MTIYNTDAYAPRNPDEDYDPPEVPEHLILQQCQKWAEDPPDWLRLEAETYWIRYWEEHKEWP